MRIDFIIKKIIMFLPFYLILKPLILINYRKRVKSAVCEDGKNPDEWYWADLLAVNCGYFVKPKMEAWQKTAIMQLKTIEYHKQQHKD
jgi:hypothetical protein